MFHPPLLRAVLVKALLVSSPASFETSSSDNAEVATTYQFHVAPMQGYTNAPLRHFFRLLSPNAILWTEMEKVKDLNQASSEALQKRFGDPAADIDHYPSKLTLQLGGSDTLAMEECIHGLNQAGYCFQEINLNCGCPSVETGGADFGASLMRDSALTRQLVECISKARSSEQTTVSLKCRSAAFETLEDMEQAMSNMQDQRVWWKEEHFQSLCSYIESARDGGISHVILHARPAILAGLSPTKNRLVPPLDYDFVSKVAAEFPGLRVTLNGGIKSMDDLLGLQAEGKDSPIQSHMAGRWLLQKPLSLAVIEDECLNNSKAAVNTRSASLGSRIVTAVDMYMLYVEQNILQKTNTISELCLPLYLVIEELRNSFDEYDSFDGVDHDYLSRHEDQLYTTLRDAIERLVHCIPGAKLKKPLPEHANWKKVSTALKAVVGTKVYNKWKRNRNELAS